MTQIIAQQLWFTDTHCVEVRTQTLPSLKSDELLIQTEMSAISAGTELLVYRNQIPDEMTLDANLESLQNKPSYPLQYGYASVGHVIQIGAAVDSSWLNKRVFAFQPHASHFISTSSSLIPVPDDINPQAAVFLANMETAVNLIQDGNPNLGEKVVVLGQGLVGLLVSGLLAHYPLTQLIAVDGITNRRQQALKLGVNAVFDPFVKIDINKLKHQLTSTGADLIYEISGAPDALNLAIDLSGFASRIVIGSWYGNKTAPIVLGGDAHRNRLKIITSQVSSIAPELSGRWNKERRFDVAWNMIRKIKPEALISHRVTLSDADSLYKNLHQNHDDILQAVFTYL
jgi:2-desacetyl-2-hydroxyethyl bacteriochlorophyllide A dehydrogenase